MYFWGTMAAWICICLPWNILLVFFLFLFLGLVLQLIDKYVCLAGKWFSTEELVTKNDETFELPYVLNFYSFNH